MRLQWFEMDGYKYLSIPQRGNLLGRENPVGKECRNGSVHSRGTQRTNNRPG